MLEGMAIFLLGGVAGFLFGGVIFSSRIRAGYEIKLVKGKAKWVKKYYPESSESQSD